MNLLHLVFTFNLVTAIIILAGGYYLHLRYDERIESKDTSLVPDTALAGMAGVAVSLTLIASVGTLFV